MKVKIKLKLSGELLEFSNVKEVFIQDSFLFIGFKEKDVLKVQPFYLFNISYWEEYDKQKKSKN